MSKIIEALNWRYACKKFDSTKKLSETDFNTLLEALRLTPSSYGMQPWKFIVVESTQLREKLVAASWNQQQVIEASHLIVICAPKVIDEAFVDAYLADTAQTRGQDISELEGFKKMLMNITKKSSDDQYRWAKNQCYIALGSLLTICGDMKIDSCPMEGFKPKEYNNILGLDELGLTSVVACPVGYRRDDDKYSKLKKVRFPLKELVIKL